VECGRRSETHVRRAAMGYLDDAEAPEPFPVFMYDGAAGRADVGAEVKFVIPSERFKDGARLKVFCNWVSPMMGHAVF
jgi:hypothetical protein